MSSFQDFNLIPTLLTSLQEMGLKDPTVIQNLAIPRLLEGQSLVGVAETGTGKTLSYVLPILHQLKNLELSGNQVTRAGHPRALILVPTRELGEQVTKVFKPFTHLTRLRVRGIMGGTSMQVSKKNTLGQFEVLVATPGRLVKLIEKRHVDLSDVRILVLDEADQMLDKGFFQDAKFIISCCPKEKQMALFSATISQTVQQLIDSNFSGVEILHGQKSHKLVPQLTTQNWDVIDGKRRPLLEKLIKNKTEGLTLVFANTREQCDKLVQEFTNMKVSCAVYRGEMDKQQRRSNLKAFRDGKIQFLISTDLGSRGLDIQNVGRVVNYHMPQQLDSYVHRVGRTARAGRKGLVVNFITERDQRILSQIERVVNRPVNG